MKKDTYYPFFSIASTKVRYWIFAIAACTLWKAPVVSCKYPGLDFPDHGHYFMQN